MYASVKLFMALVWFLLGGCIFYWEWTHQDRTGIKLIDQNGLPTIYSPQVGTPAYEAGIQGGDIIIKIDGQATESMTKQEAIDLIQGQAGNVVILTVLRPGAKEPIDITITLRPKGLTIWNTGISIGWGAIALGVYNLLRWWMAWSYQKRQRAIEQAEGQRQSELRRRTRPLQELNPDFDFTDQGSKDEPKSP